MVRKSRREPGYEMRLEDYAVNDPSAEIWSLEARAASRDVEAMTLDEKLEGKKSCTLSRESHELRAQARTLKNQRTDVVEWPQLDGTAWIL